jgi:hypothetical protein
MPLTRLLVAAGFAVGAGLGIVGQLLAPGAPQDVAWFVSSLGLLVGCVLLFQRHLVERRDLAAAGFAFLALGEIIMQAGQGAGDAGRLASFARGVGVYVPGLLLLTWSDRYAFWVRIASLLTAIPFAAHAVLYFLGKAPTEQDPAAGIGYGLLTVAMIGWVIALYRRPSILDAAAGPQTKARGSGPRPE